MEGIDFGRIGVERRRYAVEEIRFSLARLYRGFVLWTSLYGEADGREERERREEVDHLLDLFSRCYMPRSMWLAGETRERIEDFAEKSREMRERFSAEVEERGYEEVRAGRHGPPREQEARPRPQTVGTRPRNRARRSQTLARAPTKSLEPRITRQDRGRPRPS